VICEAPDDEAASVLSLSVGSRGNVRSETLRAFSFDEMGWSETLLANALRMSSSRFQSSNRFRRQTRGS
jgi:uncharacterized protein with GYD domain